MPVGTIDHQHVDLLADQAFRPLVVVNSDGGADTQASPPVFAGRREAFLHVDVFDGNQARQRIIFVNQ